MLLARLPLSCDFLVYGPIGFQSYCPVAVYDSIAHLVRCRCRVSVCINSTCGAVRLTVAHAQVTGLQSAYNAVGCTGGIWRGVYCYTVYAFSFGSREKFEHSTMMDTMLRDGYRYR